MTQETVQRKLRETTINMSHGSGGKKMRDLIEDVFLDAFHKPLLVPLEDQAVMNLAELSANGARLAFTTDSYVVSPLFFPGGNIGTLAVNGTVNDLAMCGAKPLYLSCGMVLEEGLSVDVLRQIAASMRDAVRFCFDICAKGTVVEGAMLEILEIQGKGLCRVCGENIALTQLVGRCKCGSNNLQIVAGEELKVKEIEV